MYMTCHFVHQMQQQLHKILSQALCGLKARERYGSRASLRICRLYIAVYVNNVYCFGQPAPFWANIVSSRSFS